MYSAVRRKVRFQTLPTVSIGLCVEDGEETSPFCGESTIGKLREKTDLS